MIYTPVTIFCDIMQIGPRDATQRHSRFPLKAVDD